MLQVLLSAFPVTVLIAGTALLVDWFAGRRWALTTAIVLLLVWVMQQLLHRERLIRWLNDPERAVPTASGRWDILFSTLYRRDKANRARLQTLQEDLQRMREASQAMPDGTVILATDNSIEWCNHTASRHLGLNPQTDIGMPIANLVRHPEFVRYLLSGEYNQPVSVRMSSQPPLTLQMQIVRFAENRRLLLTRDISQEERLDAVRRDFVANVSHEMKTPLTVVAGFIETLLDALPELGTETALQYLQLANHQATRMRQLVDDLLMLASLESTSTTPHDEQVDVTMLLNSVAEEIRLLSGGNHEIILEVQAGSALIGNHRELHSAFMNLASNAVRYTPKGGHIKLTWQDDVAGGQYCVEDDGIGIAPEHIPRLTERFYRVDRGRSRDTGGTGLGLAIVKHVLERHHATLSVTSTPGNGSCFCVNFPRTQLAAQKMLIANDEFSNA